MPSASRARLLCLAGALALVGCQPAEVDRGSLETRRSDGAVLFGGEPFTGVAVRYDERGAAVERATYRRGLKNGLEERWHDDGTLAYRAEYRDGRRDGVAETWWGDGTPRSASRYADGVAHGVQREWYRSGAPFKEVRLERGREEGLQRAWRENGKLYANYEARDGRTYGMRRSKLCFELTREEVRQSETPVSGMAAVAGIFPPAENGANPVVASAGGPQSLPYYADQSFTPRWYEGRSELPDGFHSVGSFSLVDQRGDAITEATLRGKVYVANFFFTACPGICPATMANMAHLQTELGGFGDVALVSHSVTPAADSVPVLQAYAERMRVVSPSWHLVTGAREAIYDLGKRAYFAHEDFGAAGDEAADTFLHTEHFLLVDRHGHLRGVYNGLNRSQMDQLVSDVETLRLETY